MTDFNNLNNIRKVSILGFTNLMRMRFSFFLLLLLIFFNLELIRHDNWDLIRHPFIDNSQHCICRQDLENENIQDSAIEPDCSKTFKAYLSTVEKYLSKYELHCLKNLSNSRDCNLKEIKQELQNQYYNSNDWYSRILSSLLNLILYSVPEKVNGLSYLAFQLKTKFYTLFTQAFVHSGYFDFKPNLLDLFLIIVPTEYMLRLYLPKSSLDTILLTFLCSLNLTSPLLDCIFILKDVKTKIQQKYEGTIDHHNYKNIIHTLSGYSIGFSNYISFFSILNLSMLLFSGYEILYKSKFEKCHIVFSLFVILRIALSKNQNMSQFTIASVENRQVYFKTYAVSFSHPWIESYEELKKLYKTGYSDLLYLPGNIHGLCAILVIYFLLYIKST